MFARLVFGSVLRWAGILLMLAQVMPAAAQDAYKSRPSAVTPVYQLPRPSYDSPKISLGSFLLAPSFTETLAGNDNIFANDRHQISDLVVTTAEDLSIQSQWLANAATLHAYHAHEWYTGHATENGNTYGVEGSFRFDVTQDAALELSAGIVQQPQERNSPQADRLSLARPIYNTIPVSLHYSQDWGRWHNDAEAGFLQTAYISRAEAARSGIRALYHDRISYGLSGDSWAFLQVGYSTQDWNLLGDLRNFDTLSVMGGLQVQIEDLVEVELAGGMLRQSFVFDGFPDLVTPAFSGHLVWNISPLTTLSASADRTVSGLESVCGAPPFNDPACVALLANLFSSSGGFRGSLETTTMEAGIQHEFWHNMLGQIRFRFVQNRFEPVDLMDRTYTVDLGARFLLNRNMELDISYDLNIRTANQDILLYNSGPYKGNIVSMALKAAM
jgi:hypothetical protein